MKMNPINFMKLQGVGSWQKLFLKIHVFASMGIEPTDVDQSIHTIAKILTMDVFCLLVSYSHTLYSN